MNRFYWREILLFSFIVLSSLFLMVEVLDFTACVQTRPLNIQSIAAIMMAYTGLGLVILAINRHISRNNLWFNKKYWQIGLVFVAVLLLMFVINFLLLVFVRMLMDIPNAYCVCKAGWRLLLFVWLVQLVMLCLLLNNSFYRNMISLYRRNAHLEHAEMISHYKALQSQLNPHFLFNSLNTLVSEIEYDPKTAVEFTRKLSDVYRYILQCGQKKTVSLREELDFLSAYLFLHIVRLGPCIKVNSNIPEELLEYNLPPLTLQLLAENIVKHNVISSVQPMEIEIYVENEGKTLCVSNPIYPKYNVASAGKGLENLRQRFYLLSKQSIEVEKINDRFVVKVPLL